MKKVLTLSLIVLLASPMFVGCKGTSCLGGNCFTRNGSRVPTAASSYDDGYLASNDGPRVVNASANSGEIMMMGATSAYSQCAPCAPTQCQPCAAAQCNPCDPCGAAPQGGQTSAGYPAGAYSSL